MKQVITIEPGGVMSGLQVKPGKGLDLTKFGPASVQRASEICWDDTEQKWFVKLTDLHWPQLMHHMVTEVLHLSDFQHVVEQEAPDVPHRVDPEWEVLFFDSYDDAVATEVVFLNAARLKGLIT